jgi:hypothetical protein
MPPRFAYGSECPIESIAAVVATPLCRRFHASIGATVFTATERRRYRVELTLDYFFTNRPRFSERKFAGKNSPSFRINLPSK